MLVHAIVVAGDGSGSNVNLGSNLRVAQVREMVGLGILSQFNFLGFDEVPDMRTFADFAAGAKMRIRADDRATANARLIHHGSWAYGYQIANLRVFDDAVRTHPAIGTNAS